MAATVDPKIIARKTAAKKKQMEDLEKCPPIAVQERLKAYPLRYIKVAELDKKPLGLKWNVIGSSANYEYNDPELLKHMQQGGNYGVCCGIGDLLVVDIDISEELQYDGEQRLYDLGILQKLPPTFTVRTRSGGFHLYYICKDFDKKVVLYDPDRTWKNSKNKNKEEYIHLGELQWVGQQVVGATSRFDLRDKNTGDHIKIQTWKVEYDKPLAEVKREEILKIFGDKVRYSSKVTEPKKKKEAVAKQIVENTPPVEPEQEQSSCGCASLSDMGASCSSVATKKIPLRVDLIAPPNPIVSDMSEDGGEIQGTHPFHESTSGRNYSINPEKNVWHCFHHGTGGGPMTLVAMKAGILQCEECVKGALRGDKWEAALNAAHDMGYQLPDRACNKDYSTLYEQIEKVLKALVLESEVDPEIFVFNNRLTRVLEDGGIQFYTSSSLTSEVSNVFGFYKTTKTEIKNIYPPTPVINGLLERGSWPGLPLLKGVSTGPIFRKDLSVCTTPGYDEVSGWYYNGEPITLPEKIDRAMVLEAANQLDHMLFGNFIFDDVDPKKRDPQNWNKEQWRGSWVRTLGEPSASNAWTLLMVTLLRGVFGLVPGFALTKPEVASGASLLSVMIGYLVYGMTEVHVELNKREGETWGDNEQIKGIETALNTGDHYLVMDNRHDVQNEYLNSLITERQMQIRPFGKNTEQQTIDNQYMVVINGKNLTFTDDTGRRFIVIELLENKFLDFPVDLLDVVLKYRYEILRLLMIMVQGWVQAGCPPATVTSEIKEEAKTELVSFRDALRIVEGILQFAGIDGAYGNSRDVRERSNPEREEWETFFRRWALEFGSDMIRSDDLPEKLQSIERYLPFKLRKAVHGDNPRSVGSLLGQQRKKRYLGYLRLMNDKIIGEKYWWMEGVAELKAAEFAEAEERVKISKV